MITSCPGGREFTNSANYVYNALNSIRRHHRSEAEGRVLHLPED